MSSYFYRGRHRMPSRTTRNVVTVAALGMLAFAGVDTVAHAAEAPQAAGDLDRIAACESGNRNVESASTSSSASGYWQIIDSTWRANGGTQFAPRAIQATKDEQRIVAERIAARRGSYADWAPSQGCWGGKVGKPSASSGGSSQVTSKARSNPTRQRGATSIVKDTGRAADGTGTYTCDTAHLSFDACDPSNLGQVVSYPRYDSATGRVTPAAGAVGGKHRKVEKGDTLSQIAVESGTTWRALAEKNGLKNPDLILPGQVIAL